jgi:5S rRNA maturation endonuclease (ribonuclease M5)
MHRYRSDVLDAYKRFIDAARDKGLTVQELDGRAMVQCPAHNDGRPSLSVRPIEGSVLVYCMAGCQTLDVVEGLGLSMSDLFDDSSGFSYEYPGGRIVKRTPDKKFIQSGNKADTSLYRADRIGDGKTVYVVEGEKDVLAVESVGGQAVSAPNGASASPERYDWEPLRGKTVRVIADRDAPGAKRAKDILAHLEGIADSACIVDPAVGKDAADHIAAGYALDDLRFRQPSDVITMSQAFDSWLTWRDSDRSEPIPTPWQSLNKGLAGGLHPGRLYVVAARTGQGKSVAGQNMVSYAVMHGHPSLVVSVEMPVVEVVSRILAAQAGIDYSVITKREFGENLTAVDDYIQGHRSMPMYLCDNPTVTVEQIAQKCRTLKETTGLSMLFLDYAQLVSPSDRRVSRQEQVAHIVRATKLIAMELEIAVVLAAQLNRNADSEVDGRTPKVSDLRESGELEQSADVILLLHQEPNSPSIIVNIAKNRTGPPKSISLIRRFDQARLDAV